MSIRTDLHTPEGVQTYAAGMNASVSDKAKILPYIKPGSILEIGCGNGTVLELISEAYPESTVYGVDMSAQLLGLATQRKYDGPVKLYCCDAKKLHTVDGTARKFSTIVFCSVLHEIFSGYLARSVEDDPIEDAFKDTMSFVAHFCEEYLEDGGRLIIRDGVRPKSEMVYVEIDTPEQRDTFFRFADDFSPFQIEFSYCSRTNKIKMPSVHLFEFLTKYFYEKNWNIEVTEQFGWANPESIEASLNDCFQENLEMQMQTVEGQTYTLDFLRNKWAGDFTLTDMDGQEYVPHSTMIYVAQKENR
jgi:SAM-dependent methyltransferase